MKSWTAERCRSISCPNGSTAGGDNRRRSSRQTEGPRRPVRVTTDARSIMTGMTMPDHEAERARLTGVYAEMSEEELRKIGESGDELSVAAQEALLAEASKRGFM